MSVTNGIPRGIRNNNPLNIKRTPINWEGKSAVQNDPVFEQFDSPYHGIRAGARNLLTYFRERKLKTVAEIIDKWAPPDDDNNTSAYVDHVASKLGVAPDDVIDVEDDEVRRALVVAMMQIEIGTIPYSDGVIRSAVVAAKVGGKPGPVVVVPADVTPAPPAPAPAPAPIPQPAPQPAPPPVAPQPIPIPNIGKPPLVDQPTDDTTNKVKAATLGALAGYPVAWIAKVFFDQYGPGEPMPLEVALGISALASSAVAYIAGYYKRNRAAPTLPT